MNMIEEWSLIENLFDVKVIDNTSVAKRELEIRKIAMIMFSNYFNENERDELLFGVGDRDSQIVNTYIDKAETLYEFSGDFETAKKFLHLLSMHPKQAASWLDQL